MNIFNRNRKFTWAALCYLCLIFIQSSIPSQYVPKMTILSYDKLIHAGIYFIAAILMYLALREHEYIKSVRTEWLALILTVFFGFTDELHQFFVQGRHASFWDFLADSIGAVLGIVVISEYLKRKKLNQAKKEGLTS